MKNRSFTKQELLDLQAYQVSYTSQFGGIGIGYKIPKHLINSDDIVWVNRGNGYHPLIVKEITEGPERYLNALGLMR